VQAQVGIKLFGDDLSILRRTAQDVKSAIKDVPGIVDLQVEQQVEIPQLQIQLRREELARHGLNVDDVNEFIETAMNGRTVSPVLEGQRSFDLVVRLDEPYREDVEYLKRLVIHLPTGGGVPLSAVADIVQSSGPNTINRENVRRRMVIQCNVADRDLAGVVSDIQKRLQPIAEKLPTGYFIEYGGQFESQQSATRMIGLLSFAGVHVSGALHAVRLGEPFAAGAGRAADGRDRRRRGASDHWPVAYRRQSRGLHLARGDRLA
jgi:HME family heavy-metal exporter